MHFVRIDYEPISCKTLLTNAERSHVSSQKLPRVVDALAGYHRMVCKKEVKTVPIVPADSAVGSQQAQADATDVLICLF